MTEKKYECTAKHMRYKCSETVPNPRNCHDEGGVCIYLAETPPELSPNGKLCDYEEDCARSTFATCVECDKNRKNQKPKLVICPNAMVTYDGCSYCDHATPHKPFDSCRGRGSQICEARRCIPIKPKARITSESTDDKPGTGSSGQPNRGGSSALSSCPCSRTPSARGAEMSPPPRFLSSWHIRPDFVMVTIPILTLGASAAALCVCHVIAPKPQENVCVLDADGGVITSLPTYQMRSVGAANPRQNESTSNTGKSSDSEYATGIIKKYTGDTTREKKSGTGNGLLWRGKKKWIKHFLKNICWQPEGQCRRWNDYGQDCPHYVTEVDGGRCCHPLIERRKHWGWWRGAGT